MATGIKNKVAIIGMGCSHFGERWDKGIEDLIAEAFGEAIVDAGIQKSDIEAAWFGCCYEEISMGKSGVRLGTTLKLPYIPITRVENLCATGSEALRGACYAVASGAADIALAMGAEKLKDTGYGGLPSGCLWGTDNRTLIPNTSGPGSFAQVASAYFAKYNISAEDGKRALARISWKSHQNGTLAEKSHLKNTPTMEQIIGSPMVAYPLGLFDCCGVSDGAACAIVCRADMAKKFRPDPIYVKSMQISASHGEALFTTNWDGSHVIPTEMAAKRAYAEAGIKDPREELSLFEVHDCFSITELATYEDLGISPRGGAVKDIMDGFYDLNGKIPCQPDGGLKCFGHPIGASGLRMMYECYRQLQGKVEPARQIKNPKLALTHNLGGFPANCVVSVNIVGNEL
jgi:acetyl-CoA C-acetyltransferase